MDCYNSCECPEKKFKGACFSQGFVEFDHCKAECLYSTFDFKFFCEGNDKVACKNECQIIDCEANCPVGEFKRGVCAKDGIVYDSKCKMNCRNPDTETRWVCNYPFSLKECEHKCVHALEADLGITHHHDVPHHNHHHSHEASVIMVGSSKL